MRTPRGPMEWNWAQGGIRADATAEEFEAKLTTLRALLPTGEAVLWAEPEEDPEPELPSMILLTMAVP